MPKMLLLWTDLFWDAHVQEWDIIGVSTDIEELPPAAAGYEMTKLHVKFHVSRKVGAVKAIPSPLCSNRVLFLPPLHTSTIPRASDASAASLFVLLDARRSKLTRTVWPSVDNFSPTGSLLRLEDYHATVSRWSLDARCFPVRDRWCACLRLCLPYALSFST